MNRPETSPANFAAVMLAFLLATSGLMSAASECTINQITNTIGNGNGRASISASSQELVFNSLNDLTGSNPDGNDEIFLFSSSRKMFTQVTDTVVPFDNTGASINAGGTRIAFFSNADLTGDNPNHNNEIFLFRTETNTFTQITHAPPPAVGEGSGSFFPSINAAGTRIAFESNRNLTGKNADGNLEIFLVDTSTKKLTQITSTTGGFNADPSLSANGRRIAFESSGDLTGTNADGNEEIFLFDVTANTLLQITNTIGSDVVNHGPKVNAVGTQVFFSSNADLTGNNPDRNFEIFSFDATTGVLTQVTDTIGGQSGEPSINASGTRIAFESDRDFTGANSAGALQIFLYNATSKTFMQVTESTIQDSTLAPAIDSSGNHVAFTSNADPTGNNPDHNFEIFLADCSPAQNGVK